MIRSLPMTRANLRGALVELGWHHAARSTADLTDALEAFQYGYALGSALAVDGVNGPRTREAVRTSLRNHRSGRPDASVSFSFREFACSCGGAYAGCRTQLVDVDLLRALDLYRLRVGGPVRVVSGYRCPERNRRVGGAVSSQHLWGGAADVDYRLTWQAVLALHVFGGIGRSRRTGLVRHVDVRHASGHNLTGGTPARPTVWDYAA